MSVSSAPQAYVFRLFVHTTQTLKPKLRLLFPSKLRFDNTGRALNWPFLGLRFLPFLKITCVCLPEQRVF